MSNLCGIFFVNFWVAGGSVFFFYICQWLFSPFLPNTAQAFESEEENLSLRPELVRAYRRRL